MRSRRRQPDAGTTPSGRAEVELFTFWEHDVAGDPPAEPPAAPEEELSTSPLWCAGALALVFLLAALLL